MLKKYSQTASMERGGRENGVNSQGLQNFPEFLFSSSFLFFKFYSSPLTFISFKSGMVVREAPRHQHGQITKGARDGG
jgi:hypothetical protein